MRKIHWMFLALSGLMAASTTTVWADSSRTQVALLPKYKQECAACHIAYPAGMLPPVSWQRVMGNLKQHYGADASLDEASVREISSWLNTHAGTYKRVSEAPPEDRITTSAWFVREHNEVPSGVWRRSSVGNKSNCAACHTKAEEGSFSERDIRIPR
jgi:mono/diheme cytochrome c family protein